MRKIALITGATSGIGKATAITLANNNFDIIITGRRKNRLYELKNTIQKNADVNVMEMCFDIQNQKQLNESFDKLPDKWKQINLLVNNAGLASGLDPIHEGDINDWEKMINTNIKGLLYITKKIAKIMTSNKTGHIVNIGSIAGKEVYPNGNVYCATKHAVDAITKAMRIDLLKHNIKVTQISPGMVHTEFSEVRFHGDKKKAEDVYKSITPLYAQDVAEAVLFAVTRPPHVNINDMLIMPTEQASSRDKL